MINLSHEQVLTLGQAAQKLGVTRQTVYRWAAQLGHRLETVKLGGKRVTTNEAIQRFARHDREPQAAATVAAFDGSGYATAMQNLKERHGF